MKRLMMAGVAIGLAGACFADVAITGITAQQRYPWNGLVDLVVTIQGSPDDVAKAECSFFATNSVTGVAVPVVSVARNGADIGSVTTWTRRFIWNAAKDIGTVKIDDLILTADAHLGVRLWENGPYWAECNVGATKPEERGYYFWWGDTIGYKRNTDNNGWVSVKDDSGFSFVSENCPTYSKNNSQLQFGRLR